MKPEFYQTEKKSAPLVMAGVLLTVLCLFMQFQKWDVVQEAELKLFDMTAHLFQKAESSDDIVIVDIDDYSLDAVGQWPWPRYRIAFLLEKIQSFSPKIIGVDILFPEKDRTSLNNIQESFSAEFGLNLQFSNLPEGMEDNDGYLADVIGEGGVVLSNYFLFDLTSTDSSCHLSPVRIAKGQVPLKMESATGVLCNISRLALAAENTGFINNYIDDDGMLRRLPLVLAYGGKSYVNLSIALLMTYFDVDELTLSVDQNHRYLHLGDIKAPIDEKGYALLNYHGKGKSYRYISAVDILNNKIDPAVFKDKFVLIGTTATGLNDFFHIAGDPHYPGVEVHATFIDNLLNSDLYRVLKWSDMLQLLIILGCGIAMTWTLVYRSSKAGIITLMGLCAGLGILLLVGMSQQWYISPVLPFGLLISIFTVLSFMNYRFQELQAVTWMKTIADAQSTTIISMAAVAESRDPETGHHLLRTQRYIKLLSEALVERGIYTHILTPAYIDLLWESAPLHDIGKVGVPDHILLKPKSLDATEYIEMQKHSAYGRDIIQSTKARSHNCGYLEMAEEIAFGHHEKWDGSGYPQGLKGDAIPLSARLMALADVYDALISQRVYKPPLPYEEAERRIVEGSGTHFDPVIVETFIELKEQFREIGETYRDD